MNKENNFFIDTILPILGLFILVLFILFINSNVQAAVSTSYDVTNIQEVKNGYNYCLIELENGNIYLLCCNHATYNYLCFNNDAQVILGCASNYSNWSLGSLCVYKYENNTFTYIEKADWDSRTYKPIKQVIGSSCDIKYMNNSAEIFFQQTPVPLVAVTVKGLETIQEIPQMMTKTIQLLIPVGLIILGLGLVILLIKSVILRMK